MKLSITKKMTFNDELLLIKTAPNGSVDAENMLYSYHKKDSEAHYININSYMWFWMTYPTI